MTAKIIDVREHAEYATGHIAGSELVSLGTLDAASDGWDRTQPLAILCRSGRRAQQAKDLLDRKGFTAVSVMPGGIEAWQNAGKPIAEETHQPWAMERQVRVAAGALVVGFAALAAWRSPRFMLGAGLVGAGLVFAGVSDTCMMASVLGRMPWNQRGQARV